MFLEKAFIGRNNWYLYVLTLLIVFIATQLASIPLGIYLLIQNPSAAMAGTISNMTSTNMGFALTMLTFVGGFFALFFCVKFLQKKQYLDIVTARRKFDWKRFFFAIGVWTIMTLLSLAWELLNSETSTVVFQFEPLNFFILVLLSLLLFPFQTSFEELVFRGYLMQGFALLFRYRWIPFVLTSVLFGLMHTANPEVAAFGIAKAMPLYILMGLIMGYLTIKDDGLELAIGLHLSNNFLSALLITSDSSALQTHALFRETAPSISYADTLLMLVSGLIFIFCCNWKYKFFHKNNLNEKIEPLPANNF